MTAVGPSLWMYVCVGRCKVKVKVKVMYGVGLGEEIRRGGR